MAPSRWWALQVGVAALALGLPTGRPELATPGALLLVTSAGLSIVLLGAALAAPQRGRPGVTPIATTDAA